MFRVIEKNSLEGIESIRSLWDELHEKSPRKHFVRSFEWLENYWKHASGDMKLKVLVVYVLDRPIGILPLVIKPYSTPLGDVKMLSYPLDGWGVNYGPVGPNAAATLSGAMKHIASSKRDWDFVDLKYVDREIEDKLRTPNGFRIAGLKVLERQWQRHSIVEIDEATSLKESTTQLAYSKFESSQQRINNICNSIDYIRYRSEMNETEELGSILGDSKEWLSEMFGESTRRHFHSFVQSSDEQRVCDLNLLKIDGQPQAILWNEFDNGHVRASKLLVSERNKVDLQNLLIGKMLKSGQEIGDSNYVLPEKVGKWGTEYLSTYRYTHFSRLGIKPQIMKWQGRIKRNLLASTGIATLPAGKAPKWKPASKPSVPSKTHLQLFTGTE